MATPETLKQKFADGKKPTGQDFAELIDTIQAGSQTEGTFVPVSEQVAIEGTDTTGSLSPAGLTAHIDARLATKGEAEAGQAAPTGEKERLMTPQRTAEAISYQANPLITTAKNALLGGVSSSYNSLKKLYDYLVGSFYTKTASDNRYDQKTDTIAGSRLQNIPADRISSGTLSNSRIRGLSNTEIASDADIEGSKLKDSSLPASKMSANLGGQGSILPYYYCKYERGLANGNDILLALHANLPTTSNAPRGALQVEIIGGVSGVHLTFKLYYYTQGTAGYVAIVDPRWIRSGLTYSAQIRLYVSFSSANGIQRTKRLLGQPDSTHEISIYALSSSGVGSYKNLNNSQEGYLISIKEIAPVPAFQVSSISISSLGNVWTQDNKLPGYDKGLTLQG